MYHFISGYTAKVAGTEVGVTGAAGDVLALLRRAVPGLAPEQVRRAAGRRRCSSTAPSVWLVNTGWSGGGYGVGKRMKLGTRARSSTRSIAARWRMRRPGAIRCSASTS